LRFFTNFCIILQPYGTDAVYSRCTDDWSDEDDEDINEDIMVHVDAAIAWWIEQGNYRHVGLKMPDVLAQMDLPYYQLRSWLRRKNLKFSD